jgi:hypothetical protein
VASRFLLDLKQHLLTLGDETQGVALAVAARSALRTVPLLEHLSWDKPLPKRMRPAVGRERMSNSAIVLGTFRCAATAWVAARFHTFGVSDRFHEIKHDARMAGGAEDAGNTPASNAPAACHFAMMAAIAVFAQRPPQSSVNDSRQRDHVAQFAAQTVAIAATGFMQAYEPQAWQDLRSSRDPQWIASRELVPAEQVVWNAASDDIRRLETGGEQAQFLAAQPLWLTPASENISESWHSLSARLLRRVDESWKVWIDWYEARLNGRGELSEASEISRVSLPNEVWAAGPAVANANLAGL